MIETISYKNFNNIPVYLYYTFYNVSRYRMFRQIAKDIMSLVLKNRILKKNTIANNLYFKRTLF